MLGSTYDLGVTISVEPAVTLPTGDCTGGPGEEIFANAVWNCSVTKDGEWCPAVRCADGFLPSQGPLAAQCVGGKFVRRQGDCYSYSMFPCLSVFQSCASKPRSTGRLRVRSWHIIQRYGNGMRRYERV
ncbi:hypothetical protein OEZ86_010427 [Tetradesmus obliquus]|nr:hypothetical protein OEZ86_010427 [Tetradesmus obliquus]